LAKAELCDFQGAAIDFYDAGRGGDEFRLVPWLFVPRVIAPQKPVITEYRLEFYYKISGRRGILNRAKEFLSVAITTLVGRGSLLPLQSVGGYSRKLRLWRWRYWREERWFCCHLRLFVFFIAFRIDGHFVAIIWYVRLFSVLLVAVRATPHFQEFKHGAV